MNVLVTHFNFKLKEAIYESVGLIFFSKGDKQSYTLYYL